MKKKPHKIEFQFEGIDKLEENIERAGKLIKDLKKVLLEIQKATPIISIKK